MPSSREEEEFEVTEVKVATDKALLVVLDTGDEVWMPLSQLLEGSEVEEVGDTGKIVIPRWLAEEKELI